MSSDGDVVAFKYSNGTKYRKGWEGPDRRFWWDPPLGRDAIDLFMPPDAAPRERMILVEGETDTMRLWQELPGKLRESVGVVGLSGLNTWKEPYAQYLEPAKTVYVVLDNDQAYQARDQGDEVWRKIRNDLGPKARRVRLPQGIKDVCEFYRNYGWPAFAELLKRANTPEWHYKPLDLTSGMIEYDWLVDPLIAVGDITTMYGPPGIGKSWVTMSLALALAGGETEWLGMPIQPGRVLYVDEENPEDVVRKRLHQLGWDESVHGETLRYYWYTGVRLDSQADRLYEDVQAFSPSLVVIDSLSRVHEKNENHAEDMNPLFNHGIIPLSRKLGASVILIHHVPHSQDGKGARRPRGSSVILAASDLGIEIRPYTTSSGRDTGAFQIVPTKLRRTARFGVSATVRIKNDSGRVRLERDRGEDF